MIRTPIVMTHADLGSLASILKEIPPEDRRHSQDLQRELKRAKQVPSNEVPDDVITMESTVHLREIDGGDLWTFTLVYPRNADARENRISILSPLGTAMIGCRVGDVVDWPIPGGT